MFPLLQPYTCRPIHCSQYFESHNNKGVTLRHDGKATCFVVASQYCSLWPQVKSNICLIWRKKNWLLIKKDWVRTLGLYTYINLHISFTNCAWQRHSLYEMLTTLCKVYQEGAHIGELPLYFLWCFSVSVTSACGLFKNLFVSHTRAATHNKSNQIKKSPRTLLSDGGVPHLFLSGMATGWE